MSVTLYDLPHSPYCIPIKRILDALAVPFAIVDVPNWDRRLVLEVTQGTYYQVPVLSHDDQVITESTASSNDIAQYVDTHFASGRLFPAALAGLHDIIISYLDDEVEGATFRACDAHYVDSIEDPVHRGMIVRHKERKFGRGCVEQWKNDIENLRAGARVHFERFDTMLQRKAYLLADQPVYADFLLFGILSNYTWKGWNEIPAELNALHEWSVRLAEYQFPKA